MDLKYRKEGLSTEEQGEILLTRRAQVSVVSSTLGRWGFREESREWYDTSSMSTQRWVGLGLRCTSEVSLGEECSVGKDREVLGVTKELHTGTDGIYRGDLESEE